MKKLSNNNGVIKSSTLAGQRELLREYRNKINEMIEEYDARFQTHEDRINMICMAGYPYTAMRSTGEFCECPNPKVAICINNQCTGRYCQICGKDTSFRIIKTKPIKPEEDIREKIANLINTQFDWERWCMHSGKEEYALADKILAIVKGE